MHDLYYKGRIHTRVNHVLSGYNTKRLVKLGTAEKPLTLVVNTDEQKLAVEKQVADNGLYANITLDSSADENLNELYTILNKPVAAKAQKAPPRNEPCVCGSGKKYKKCCA